MCGIWAVFGTEVGVSKHHDTLAKITHRGPDAWRTECDDRLKNGCLCFHRLAINDGLCGMQPMKCHTNPHLTLLCNGEIYNCKRLKEQYDFNYASKCDIECILHLYEKFGSERAADNLDGVFAFCLVDSLNRKVVIARDPFGVRPLFRMTGPGGVLGVCSEAKGLISLMEGHSDWRMDPFPPGHFEEYSLDPEGGATLIRQQQYYKIGELPRYQLAVPKTDLGNDVLENVRSLLTAAVQKRLMSDRRIGCLLSGGLDSSLIAALLVKLAKDAGIPYKVQTFSVGMGEDSPDLRAARLVAAHIGSEHYEVTFSEEDIRRVMDDVLYHLEIADITTLRASIPMYMLSKWIKENTDSTVIFSGEGADELAQGYIYFRDAPSAEEAHQESLRLLNELYIYDVLRTDRVTAAHSLEVRVPFLDHQFTSYYLSLPKESRQPQKGIEKYILRQAFDTGLLPHEILWRHKEAFSDGCASKKKPIFKMLQEAIEPRITDEQLQQAPQRFAHCTPKTKEAYYYRHKFEANFPGQDHWLPYFWMPRWSDATDPSAQFISHYAAE